MVDARHRQFLLPGPAGLADGERSFGNEQVGYCAGPGSVAIPAGASRNFDPARLL
jgi:hypothetical protein